MSALTGFSKLLGKNADLFIPLLPDQVAGKKSLYSSPLSSLLAGFKGIIK